MRAFEDALLRAEERMSRLPEERKSRVLEYLERRLGRRLRIADIAYNGFSS